MGEVAQFDPNTAIRDKVREVILESITDEQLDEYIKKVFSEFMDKGLHGRRSAFKQLIYDA